MRDRRSDEPTPEEAAYNEIVNKQFLETMGLMILNKASRSAIFAEMKETHDG